MPVLCPLNSLNEVCDGTGDGQCEAIMFSPGCGCAARSSGCDGYVCFQLYDASNGEACPCDNISLNGFGINFAGSGVNSSCTTNCDGFCSIRVSDCGPATYLMNQSSNCYELTSGSIYYQSSGLGTFHDCQRFYNIPLTPKNAFCDTSTTSQTAYDYTTYDINETDNSITIDVEVGGTNFCGGPDTASRPNQGIQVQKIFCVHCDQCDWTINLTYDETQLMSASTSIDAVSCAPTGTVSLPFTCDSVSRSAICSGTLNRGQHSFNFDYYVEGTLGEIPPGSSATCTFTLTNCRNNNCEYCTCTQLTHFHQMKFDWFDACTGILRSYAPVRFSGTLIDMGDPYCLWKTPDFTSPTVNSGTRTTRFEAVCFGGCCQPYTNFPIKPASLSYGTTYIYEFYTFGTGSPTYNSDYYIWASNQETPCSPADFNRVWSKCDGTVNYPCDYYFKIITTGCLAPCDTCEVCLTMLGIENSLPVKNKQFKVYDACGDTSAVYNGTTNEFGRSCFNLPTGQQPWCLEVLGGTCYGSGIFSPIYCGLNDVLLATATGCITHSGACTLCQGLAISRTLHASSNFQSNFTLNYDPAKTGWYNQECKLLIQNYCDYSAANSGCVCSTSGYFNFQTLIGCHKNDWRIVTKLPYRSCECNNCVPISVGCSGASCVDRNFSREYLDSACLNAYAQHSGCLPSREFTFYLSSGDFSVNCTTFDLELEFEVPRSAPCEGFLYTYSIDATE